VAWELLAHRLTGVVVELEAEEAAALSLAFEVTTAADVEEHAGKEAADAYERAVAKFKEAMLPDVHIEEPAGEDQGKAVLV